MARSTPAKRPTRRTASAAEANVGSASSTRWLTAGVLALFLFAALVSFAGLYAIAPWLGLPFVLYWCVPAFVDLAIILYKFAHIKLKQDPRKAHLAWKANVGVLSFTIVSSAGNIIHVLALANPNPLEMYGGMFFAGIAPWAVYLAASVLTDIVVKPRPKPVPPPPPVAPTPTKRARRTAQTARVLPAVSAEENERRLLELAEARKMMNEPDVTRRLVEAAGGMSRPAKRFEPQAQSSIPEPPQPDIPQISVTKTIEEVFGGAAER